MPNEEASLEVRDFDPKTASEEEYAAANDFLNRLQAERMPEDPPRSVARTRAQLQNLPAFIDMKLWGLWTPQDELVGYANLLTFRMEGSNEHLGQFELGVLPEWRRQGHGTQLLRLVAAETRARARRLLIANTHSNVPSGVAFMQRIGGSVASESHLNQLNVADVARALIDRWAAEGAARNPDYELGLWEGRYPDDQIEALAALMEATNDEPHGDLEIEAVHWTPEQVRQQEAGTLARSTLRWVMYVRDPATAKLASFTEVTWSAERPEVLSQNWTVVAPEYRNSGLGRWLKGAMLQKVLRDLPQVRYIRTHNADSNAPMLKINHTLGFKPHSAEQSWQVELSSIEQYLAERG